MKQLFKRLFIALFILSFSFANCYSQEENKEKKEIDFTSIGIHYSADFEYIDQGIYGFGWHSFNTFGGFGLSFSLNSNIGIVDTDYSSYITKFGPNYAYALSDHVCFYVPLLVNLAWTNYPTYKHVSGSSHFGDYSYEKKETKTDFNWGLELTPSFAFKVGKIVFSVGIPLGWGYGSKAISTAAIVGVGFNI